MKKPKIGVDIDETIAASYRCFPWFFSKKFSIPFAWDDFTDHEISKIPQLNLDLEAATILWGEYMDTHDHDVSAVEGSQEKLRWLKQEGFEFVAITGRHEDRDRPSTEAWIEKHFPETFESIFFTNNGLETAIPKSQICKNLGISLMVDDNLDFALELVENGIVTIMLERPWNRHRTETHPLLTRVRHWEEIPHIIQAHA